MYTLELRKYEMKKKRDYKKKTEVKENSWLKNRDEELKKEKKEGDKI